MAFLAMAGHGRSGTALRLAAIGTALFAVLVVLFNADYAFREPLLAYGFPLNALVFHVGLGYGLTAAFGAEEKRGKHAGLAIACNLIPVFLFWFMVVGIIYAIRTFT
ncbi:MAG: hypothetical protein WC876_09855 [Candidatus Thermoplasmatota archaeon]